MAHAEDTRQNLLLSAKQEFLEFGYQKASLRRICKNAGVTTGALYFFFQDKNDLFTSLVGNFAETLMDMMQEHTQQEERDFLDSLTHDFEEDQKFAKEIIHYYYENEDLGYLLLHCSAGSSYEGFVNTLESFMEDRNRRTINAIGLVDSHAIFNECTQHWLSHLIVGAFLHVLSHDFDEERALQQVEIIVSFMRGGFERLLTKAQE